MKLYKIKNFDLTENLNVKLNQIVNYLQLYYKFINVILVCNFLTTINSTITLILKKIIYSILF